MASDVRGIFFPMLFSLIPRKWASKMCLYKLIVALEWMPRRTHTLLYTHRVQALNVHQQPTEFHRNRKTNRTTHTQKLIQNQMFWNAQLFFFPRFPVANLIVLKSVSFAVYSGRQLLLNCIFFLNWKNSLIKRTNNRTDRTAAATTQRSEKSERWVAMTHKYFDESWSRMAGLCVCVCVHLCGAGTGTHDCTQRCTALRLQHSELRCVLILFGADALLFPISFCWLCARPVHDLYAQ